MRKKYLAAACLLAALAFGLWWPLGGQGWLAIHTGTVNESGGYYGYWSGFGSVFPWSLGIATGIITGVAVHWRHVNCHERGCIRVGRFPVAGGEFRFCGRHHPDWQGNHPAREHILSRHEAHKAAQAPPLSASRERRVR